VKCCACCKGDARKRVRAVIVTDSKPPRIGLVCQVCAACGVLVVPARSVLLPSKPRRVPRSALLDGMPRHAASVAIVPEGEDSE